jgi:hypothetical protein
MSAKEEGPLETGDWADEGAALLLLLSVSAPLAPLAMLTLLQLRLPL